MTFLDRIASALDDDHGRVAVIVVTPDGRCACLSAPARGEEAGRSSTYIGDLPASDLLAALIAALSRHHVGAAKLLADIPGNLAKVEGRA